MKKTSTILLLTIFVVFSLFFASSAKAVWMQVTFTITSVQVPERAVAINWSSGTEFRIDGGWDFEIVDSNGKIVGAAPGLASLSQGVKTSLTFTREDGKTYTPRLILSAAYSPSRYNRVFASAGCVNLGGSYYVALYRANGDKEKATCPGGNNGLYMSPTSINFDFNPI